jgi:hypothetical protein
MRKIFKLEYLFVIPLTFTLIILIVFPFIYLYFIVMVIINNVIGIILFCLPLLLYIIVPNRTLDILSYIAFYLDITIYVICYINLLVITPLYLLHTFLYPLSIILSL